MTSSIQTGGHWDRHKLLQIRHSSWTELARSRILWLLKLRDVLFQYQDGLTYTAIASSFMIPLCLGGSKWLHAQRLYGNERVEATVGIAWLSICLAFTLLAFLIVPGETRELVALTFTIPVFLFIYRCSKGVSSDAFTIFYFILGYSLAFMVFHHFFGPYNKQTIGWIIAIGLLLASLYPLSRYWPIHGHTQSAISSFGLSLFCTALALKIGLVLSDENRTSLQFRTFSTLVLGLFSVGGIFVMYLLVTEVLFLDIGYAVLISLFVIPVYGILAALFWGSLLSLIAYLRDQDEPDPSIKSALTFVGISIGISFFITLLAFLVGHLLAPAADVPQHLRMLLSNVVFDTITVLSTFFVFERSVRSRSRVSIPSAFLAVIVVAAISAIASLEIGLQSTPQALPLRSVLNIMVGRSIFGRQWELGPYFWSMHSTFLPILCFGSIVLITWAAKGLLRISELFLRVCRGWLSV